MTRDLAPINSITEITRRALVDEINAVRLNWAGRLEEPEFLARLFDLGSMPSGDPRFADAAGDIWQHRVRNLDWEGDWIFYDPRFDLFNGTDEQLLRFLCETVHPAVCSDTGTANGYVDLYNEHLRPDGYELHVVDRISGRPVWGARLLTTGVPALAQLRATTGAMDAAYLARQIERLDASVNSDPGLAIGTAKELLETVAKTILDERGEPYSNNDELAPLLKKVRRVLLLSNDEIEDGARGEDIIRRLLGSLGTIVQGLAELRNYYGTGHGKPATSGGLNARHARLAAGAAATLATFLWETNEARPKG